MQKFSINDVLDRYQGVNISLVVKKLDDEDFVYIGGDSASLMFLSELIMAQAVSIDDDNFHISPDGAGCDYFSGEAKFGLLIHNTGIRL